MVCTKIEHVYSKSYAVEIGKYREEEEEEKGGKKRKKNWKENQGGAKEHIRVKKKCVVKTGS